MAAFADNKLEFDLSLEHEFEEQEDEGAFGALVAVNHKWLGHYARMHATFSVEQTLLERNSIWMNSYFQKNRMITSPWSKEAKSLLRKHYQTVHERLRCVPSLHSESEFSTQAVEPIAALMFAASIDRCPEVQIEYLISEAIDLLECRALRANANRSGLAGCVFRFLSKFTEEKKRILCLQLLVTLADDDAKAVVRACHIAAQGQPWQPNMFIYTLQKRHSGNETIRKLVSQLLTYFSKIMPITSPIQLNSSRAFKLQETMRVRESSQISDEDYRLGEQSTGFSTSPHRRSQTLPSLGSPKVANGSLIRTSHTPTTTISSLCIEAPSPYAPNTRLPIARPPTSPSEQSRRSRIFSTPKLAAVEGEKQRRCQTPNIIELHRGNSSDQLELDDGTNADDPFARKFGTLDPLDGSPPKSPRSESPKKRVVLTEKSSWNPECINSVSGFEWWWRSLPQNHSSLEPTQKLKVVTKAAVRLHTKGDWLRAIELYLLAISMEINEEVEFRLGINLACAYEAAQDFTSSIAAFKAALELRPTDPYAQFKLGEVLASTGAFDEARKLFESVLSAYPQANEALKKLRLAEELQTQEEEAKRAAIAAAKRCRSPSKKNRSQQSEEQRETAERSLLDSACHPVAPLTPTNSSPASRRILPKVKKSDTRPSAPTNAAPSAEKTMHTVATKHEQPMASSASDEEKLDAPTTTRRNHAADDSSVIPSSQVASAVAMTSDLVMSVGSETDTGAIKPNLVTLLAKCCVNLHFDFKQYMLQIDQQQQGLIRVGSLAEIFRILCGIDPAALSDSSFTTELKHLFPEDWGADHQQEILRYRPFLQAYETQHSLHEHRMSAADERRLKPLLDDVAKKEINFFMRRLTNTKVALWLEDGIQRAVGLLEKNRVSACTDDIQKDSPVMQGPLVADVEMQDLVLPQDLHVHDLRLKITEGHAPDGDALIDEEETDSFGPILSEEESHRYVLDGYTSLSPHLDEKREKAREQHILLREKSRIISRKHTHCMKSLRDIVTRARKHQADRWEALAFFKMIARDAFNQIARERVRVEATATLKTGQVVEVPQHEGDHLTIAEPMEQQQAFRHCISEVSHKVYSSALTGALRNMHAREELQQLQSLARQYASFSGVPPYFLEICLMSTTHSDECRSEAESSALLV